MVSQALVMITLSIVVAVSARGASLPGQEAYIRHNYAKAMKEFMADNSPRAMYMIGYMYGHGEGVALDDKAAADWYRKSGEKGFALAQYRLGMLYENGVGGEKDLKESVKWYKLAAAQGFQPAKDALKKIAQNK